MRLKIIKITAMAAAFVILASCGDRTGKSSSGAASGKKPSSASSETAEYIRGPKAVGGMTLSGLFYIPKQSSVVRLVDIRGASAEAVTALRALQGLIAREKSAAVYLFQSESDEQWKIYLESEYGVYFDDCTPAQLFTEFSELISAFYLYSPDKTEYFSPLLTIAACENAIPVTEEALEGLMSASLAGIERRDFRDKWKNTGEASSEANEYISKTNPNYIYTGGASAFLDYAYAVKAFCVSAEALADPNGSLCARREDAGRPSLIFTKPETSAALSSLSALGYARINCAQTQNITFFSSLPAQGKNHSQPASVDRKAQGNKIYYSIVLYDGQGGNLFSEQLENIWEKANNINLPFGIQINPVISELTPAALARYYHHRSSNGELISQTGGFAEIDEKTAAPTILSELYGLNDIYLKKSGIRVETLKDGLPRFAERTVASENNEVSGASGTEASGPEYILNPLPDYISSLTINSPEELTAFFDNTENKEAARFFSLFIDITRFGEADVWDTARLAAELAGTKHPGRFEALLPGDLISTAKKYQETLASAEAASESANSSSKKK